ncbi:MAG: hypothetical protein Kow0099_10400 [Candidatus Abyssubacteria bacterium]
MKASRCVLAVALAVVVAVTLIGEVKAETKESITITIDRKVYPAVIFHPGLCRTQAETVTLDNYAIRDYLGVPIEGFIIQTISGQTEVPLYLVKEIKFDGCVRHKTEDIDHIYFVQWADMTLVDGTQMRVLMNADFGTIEGDTEDGEFFLGDPHTVRHLVFNR